MVKYALQVCARIENLKSLATCGEDFRWYFKVRCGNCSWESESPLYVTIEDHVEVRRAIVNLAMKCHMCSREIHIEIHRATVKPYSDEDEKFQTIAEFELRGAEPFDFDSSQGWVIVTQSGKVFNDVDLSSKEWCEYDEEMSASVGLYDFRSQFIHIGH